MNEALLTKHIQSYLAHLKKNPEKHRADLEERQKRIIDFQAWNRERLMALDADGLYEYLAPLWAMLIWGNKHYVTDKLIDTNGLPLLRAELAELVWGGAAVAKRWDRFRQKVKGIGPAMMSELMCHTHPDQCAIWNRRAYAGLNYLGVEKLPRYDYQMDGKRYELISARVGDIVAALQAEGSSDANMLTADYFIWDELQVESNLSRMFDKAGAVEVVKDAGTSGEAAFVHNEIRDKLAAIGAWLGFNSRVEVKVADGSVVDTVWEATIGNMGRVIYVFEVQVNGSTNTLILNLLKSLNNPAVQGVVAVSDAAQIEKIKKHSVSVPGLSGKLKYWDYLEVLAIHDALALVNEKINSLGLVPQGF